MPTVPFEDFMEEYSDDQIGIESYAEEGQPDPRAAQLTTSLLADAKAEGYTDAELAGWEDKLPAIIARRFESNTDAEVRRLVAEDD